MQEALNYFANIQDPRSNRNLKHPLRTLIGTSLLASLGGIDSFNGMADYTEAYLEELSDYFDFPAGAPSHDTYQRFWEAISTEDFYNSFHEFTNDLEKINGDIISVDGKEIRHSGRDKPLHIVSAWCRANQLTLAQEKVDRKSNEITAIPRLLKLLDINNRIITIDAMGAQRTICSQIVEEGGDYVISLKGNQGTLHQDVIDYFSNKKLLNSCNSSEEHDKGHGRIEQRIAHSCDDIEWLQSNHNWPGLKSIGVVKSSVEKKGKKTQESRYYISSKRADAKFLNHAARSHWCIENQLHWRLDVIFNEDGSCIRNDNAAENIDILRKWALNVLPKAKTKPNQSIKSVMRKNAMSFKHMKNTLKTFLHA